MLNDRPDPRLQQVRHYTDSILDHMLAWKLTGGEALVVLSTLAGNVLGQMPDEKNRIETQQLFFKTIAEKAAEVAEVAESDRT
jgi:hypothetical protein